MCTKYVCMIACGSVMYFSLGLKAQGQVSKYVNDTWHCGHSLFERHN